MMGEGVGRLLVGKCIVMGDAGARVTFVLGRLAVVALVPAMVVVIVVAVVVG